MTPAPEVTLPTGQNLARRVGLNSSRVWADSAVESPVELAELDPRVGSRVGASRVGESDSESDSESGSESESDSAPSRAPTRLRLGLRLGDLGAESDATPEPGIYLLVD